MKIINYIIALFLSLYLLASCTASRSLHRLKKDVTEVFSKQKGVFAIACKDIITGKELLINEKEVFHAASTMKTPVLIEVYKQAAAGKFSLTDSILIKNEFRSIVDSSIYTLSADDDSEQGLYKLTGRKKTISALVYDMIIVSSNYATNLIIERVGATNVTKTMRELGAPTIQVRRGVEDDKAFEKGLNNTTTAYDLMIIFEKIASGQAVDATSSQAMINTLLDQRFNEIIPARLPKDVKVAHKTGSITGVHHDSGIVLLPDGRKYVLVMLSKNLQNEGEAVKAMAEVSEMIYHYIKGLK